MVSKVVSVSVRRIFQHRHCEERSDAAIHLNGSHQLDCFASLAMTACLASPCFVIARSEATKQSIWRLPPEDGLPGRCAPRNDDGGVAPIVA
jgi:hypothetical protein